MKQTNFEKLYPGLGLAYYVLVLSLIILVKHPIELLILYIAVTASLIYRDYLMGEYLFHRKILTYLLPFIFMIFTATINSMFRHYGFINLFRLSNGNYFTLDSIIDGAQGGFRLGLCVLWIKHLNEHISTNNLLFLFKGLFPGFALLLTLVFRFFPHYLNQARELIIVNKLSNEDKKLGIKANFTNTANVLAKLSSWALESSINTAQYMQARGLGISDNKTSYKLYKWRTNDSILLLIISVAMAGYFLMRAKGYLDFIYYPFTYVPEWQGLNFVMLILLSLVAFLPLIVDIKDY